MSVISWTLLSHKSCWWFGFLQEHRQEGGSDGGRQEKACFGDVLRSQEELVRILYHRDFWSPNKLIKLHYWVPKLPTPPPERKEKTYIFSRIPNVWTKTKFCFHNQLLQKMPRIYFYKMLFFQFRSKTSNWPEIIFLLRFLANSSKKL